MDNAEIIKKFYVSFQNKDWEGMQQCYHDNVQFSDPVFPNLHNKEAKAMWHMLVAASSGLTVTFSNIQATSHSGSCHWEAVYRFSKTGRMVHNKIEANFTFRDGLITKHQDHFDLWKWGRMALGLPGMLFGWAPFMKNRIQRMANRNLAHFMDKNPIYNS